MIGLGIWEASVNMMFFKGTGRITISKKNGGYDFKLDVVGEKAPDFKVYDVREEGNTLFAVAETELFPGKKIPMTASFDGDNVLGTAKIPLLGNIKVRGHRVG